MKACALSHFLHTFTSFNPLSFMARVMAMEMEMARSKAMAKAMAKAASLSVLGCFCFGFGLVWSSLVKSGLTARVDEWILFYC